VFKCALQQACYSLHALPCNCTLNLAVQCITLLNAHGLCVTCHITNRWGQLCVEASLVLSQLGFCSTYFLFVSKNVTAVLRDYLALHIATQQHQQHQQQHAPHKHFTHGSSSGGVNVASWLVAVLLQPQYIILLQAVSAEYTIMLTYNMPCTAVQLATLAYSVHTVFCTRAIHSNMY
jgi:hypothetical protein